MFCSKVNPQTNTILNFELYSIYLKLDIKPYLIKFVSKVSRVWDDRQHNDYKWESVIWNKYNNILI